MSDFLKNAGTALTILGNMSREVKDKGLDAKLWLSDEDIRKQREADNLRFQEESRQYDQRKANEFAAWAAAAKAAQQNGMRIPELPFDQYTRAYDAGLVDLARQANPRGLAGQDAMHLRALSESNYPLSEAEQARLNDLARHLYLQEQQQQQQRPQMQPQIQPQMPPQMQPQMQKPTEFKPQSSYDDPALEEERLRQLARGLRW